MEQGYPTCPQYCVYLQWSLPTILFDTFVVYIIRFTLQELTGHTCLLQPDDFNIVLKDRPNNVSWLSISEFRLKNIELQSVSMTRAAHVLYVLTPVNLSRQ